MPSLCCFLHPQDDFSPKALTDTCPGCGRSYGFPLTSPPSTLESYRDLEPLGRGFYAATYSAVAGRLGARVVLKIAPIAVYAHFGKDFQKECELHREVADGTEHLVEIRDMFDYDVDFAGTVVPCHIAVLEYVQGISLRQFTADPALSTPTAMAQIAIDLFRLLQELQQKRVFHNDLHDENIMVQQLSPTVRRPDSVQDDIRVVAVDLGSLAPFDRRDDNHLGDLQAIVRHLFTMLAPLLDAPESVSDVEYRLAAALEEIGHSLAPDAEKLRTPDYEETIRRIRAVFEYVTSPWQEPVGLQRFDDAYNAQTLHPWFVPQLLIDPDGQWLRSVTVRGPQVITGMRGCGKTMLLRSLQFHARAFNHQQRGGGSIDSALATDGYVGLYVSCTRLLDALGDESHTLHEPYARLFAAYAREATRAVGHLRKIEREVGRQLVAADAHRRIGDVCASYLAGADVLKYADGEYALEQSLQRVLMSLDRGESAHRLLANPTVAFPQLGQVLTGCAQLWANSQVLFLLDDVSTRHLDETAIVDLLSTLLFSDPTCAFKMTTELQTLELVLKSPGRIEKARAGRDYNLFDLGAAVNAKLRDHKSQVKGKQFIADVLSHRAAQYRLHPNVAPADILGDTTLEQIASTIASSASTSREKKSAYHGLTALTAMCVGDIGDVISVYELILRRATARRETQASPATQSECFQEYCSRRLYGVSRRGNRLKDFALTFAAASHDLLVRSYREEVRFGKGRLRQYNSVYVRLTTSDTDEHYRQLRDLVDAGVFVLEGGPDSPRTKSRDRDPVQQFVLTYRKLFGLSSFVGLAERDRFELSGDDLVEWLTYPERGKDVLLRNLGGPLLDAGEGAPGNQAAAMGDQQPVPRRPRRRPRATDEAVQLQFDGPELEPPAEELPASTGEPGARAPHARRLTDGEAIALKPDNVVIGLGFEERAAVSAQRLLDKFEPGRAVLVRYDEPGRGAQIEAAVREHVPDVTVFDYRDVVAGQGLTMPPGLSLVDITGLAKPVLFHSVRDSLLAQHRVVVAHTRADVYYPLDGDIERVLRADSERDSYALMDALQAVWPGERGPYRFVRLLPGGTDVSRRRVLCAAATAKHERLLSLLEEREYDTVTLVAPSSHTPRSQLARLAAEVALPEEITEEVDSGDLAAELDFVSRKYNEWFLGREFAFELGLTGSKTHAVACAAAAAAFKVSECWYVAPSEFDTESFSKGVGRTTFHEVRSAPSTP